MGPCSGVIKVARDASCARHFVAKYSWATRDSFALAYY